MKIFFLTIDINSLNHSDFLQKFNVFISDFLQIILFLSLPYSHKNEKNHRYNKIAKS